MSKNSLSLAIALSFITYGVSASTYAPDGRTNAMGNAGVATADYLAAALYNPALVAVFDKSDDVGVLLPALGINVKDADNSIDTIDDLQDAIDSFESANSASKLNEIDRLLTELDGKKPINVNGGAAFAVAIPSNTVSLNLYGLGYVESFAKFNVSSNADTEKRYEQSDVTLTSFGYAETGLAIAKRVKLGEQDFSFGITPKYQLLKTHFETMTVEDFDFEYNDENETSESAINVDLGSVWMKDNYRIGLSLQNLIKQEVTSKNGYTYELNPQATVAFAYAAEYFTFAVDIDLTDQERFVGVEDNTQFIRAGVEFNAWHWAQLRFGYEHDSEDTLDDSVTAGIGISPFGTLNIDVAASYANAEQAGVAASLSFTF